jgi:4-diphosphocytidyl-2-C-methyl-D-erythritol kinase
LNTKISANTWISEKACAKINLALHVLGRRLDGYHELDSVVAFADFGDELRIRKSPTTTLTVLGPFARQVPAGSDNIVIKAHAVLGQILQLDLPNIEIELIKNLPVASGIGGGSADAAAYMRAMLRMLKKPVNETEIKSFARSLGADVPVCFYQTPCHMQGIGETISVLTINLPSAIVLVNPAKPCATPAVFAKLALSPGQNHGSKIDLENSPIWRNDLTAPALQVEPDIERVLESLLAEQCFSAARMSGSGATCFGLASNMALASAAAARLSVRNPNWWVKAAELL